MKFKRKVFLFLKRWTPKLARYYVEYQLSKRAK
jgi:hypothetical protein